MMTSEVLREIQSRLPVDVAEAWLDNGALYLRGTEWRLRVSGAWRVTKSGLIEIASNSEEGEVFGDPASLAGVSVVEVFTQSPISPLDVGFTLNDGRRFEMFSNYFYDCWLMSLGEDFRSLEGPLSPAGPEREEKPVAPIPDHGHLGQTVAKLPLLVASCRQEETTDVLAGPGWEVRLWRPWRLLHGGVMKAAGDDIGGESAALLRQSLVGRELVDVLPQSPVRAGDIVLVTDDGHRVEVFSDHVHEGWRLTVGTETIAGPVHPA
jgi:hypothetical protein